MILLDRALHPFISRHRRIKDEQTLVKGANTLWFGCIALLAYLAYRNLAFYSCRISSMKS